MREERKNGDAVSGTFKCSRSLSRGTLTLTRSVFCWHDTHMQTARAQVFNDSNMATESEMSAKVPGHRSLRGVVPL